MRRLINYFRESFCKHDFEREEGEAIVNTNMSKTSGTRISATCKKCGYHKSYWKYIN
jgi:hypothetical protein